MPLIMRKSLRSRCHVLIHLDNPEYSGKRKKIGLSWKVCFAFPISHQWICTGRSRYGQICRGLNPLGKDRCENGLRTEATTSYMKPLRSGAITKALLASVKTEVWWLRYNCYEASMAVDKETKMIVTFKPWPAYHTIYDCFDFFELKCFLVVVDMTFGAHISGGGSLGITVLPHKSFKSALWSRIGIIGEIFIPRQRWTYSSPLITQLRQFIGPITKINQSLFQQYWTG